MLGVGAPELEPDQELVPPGDRNIDELDEPAASRLAGSTIPRVMIPGGKHHRDAADGSRPGSELYIGALEDLKVIRAPFFAWEIFLVAA